MNKGLIWFLVFIVLLIGGGIGAYFILQPYGLPVQSVVEVSSFTPIFCNDYEFTCCNEQEGSYSNAVKLASNSFMKCGVTSSRCVVTNIQGSCKVGSGVCDLYDSFASKDYWKCSVERDCLGTTETLMAGESIYVGHSDLWSDAYMYFNFQRYFARLDFTGRSSGSGGVPVLGATQCTFVPLGGKIYTSSSMTSPLAVTSYTVPLTRGAPTCVLSWQGNDRHICGYKEESCSSNADCGGHPYGNVDCNARVKQTYGCQSYGTVIQTTVENGLLIKGDVLSTADPAGDVPDQSQSIINTFGKRCGLVKSEQVQCCGDADCGSNSFCDVKTFTCSQQVQCRQDSDCGVSTQCDFASKLLKTPKCSGGQCSYDSNPVECCYKSDCPEAYTCDVDHKCKEEPVVKKQCVFECCVGELLYFDKVCAGGKFCVNNVCETEGCKGNSDCKADEECKNGDCVKAITEKIKCEQKAVDQSWLGWSWVEESSCGFWCSLGLSDPTITGYCKATALLYYILGGVLLLVIVGVFIVILVKMKKKRG